ncbi:MAG: type II toxin-antitoxin system VapC family toxin [Thermomicrobiales bacterium]
MIVDTSAIVRILLEEPGWLQLVDVLATEPNPSMSAASLLEVFIVLHGRRLDDEAEWVFALLDTFDIEVVPVTLDHIHLGREAFRRFGKGIHARAKLNYGDCFSYALAKATGEPLLFVGDDFTHTDITPAHSV